MRAIDQRTTRSTNNFVVFRIENGKSICFYDKPLAAVEMNKTNGFYDHLNFWRNFVTTNHFLSLSTLDAWTHIDFGTILLYSPCVCQRWTIPLSCFLLRCHFECVICDDKRQRIEKKRTEIYSKKKTKERREKNQGRPEQIFRMSFETENDLKQTWTINDSTKCLRFYCCFNMRYAKREPKKKNGIGPDESRNYQRKERKKQHKNHHVSETVR